jgi:hypothetical protein
MAGLWSNLIGCRTSRERRRNRPLSTKITSGRRSGSRSRVESLKLATRPLNTPFNGVHAPHRIKSTWTNCLGLRHHLEQQLIELRFRRYTLRGALWSSMGVVLSALNLSQQKCRRVKIPTETNAQAMLHSISGACGSWSFGCGLAVEHLKVIDSVKIEPARINSRERMPHLAGVQRNKDDRLTEIGGNRFVS